MLRVGTVVVGVEDLGRAVEFWSRALDYVPERPVAAGDDFTILVPGSGDRYPNDADFVVLQDPEGNRFCVTDTGSGD